MTDNVHKCITCGTEYKSEDLITLRACKICNGTSFMFKSKTARIAGVGIKGREKNTSDVRVLDNGIFELNIGSLAQHDPVVIEGEEGVFFIKFPKSKK